MKWSKLGRLYRPDAGAGWMKSHAMVPLLDEVDGRPRVYFSGRDDQGRARIGYFEMEFGDTPRALATCRTPVVDIGPLGTFDDHGVTTAWMVTHEGVKYLYYTGWTLGVTVLFYVYIGLAISEDGGHTFRKVSQAPVLERNEVDPYLTGSPCVLVENGMWRMWYGSGTGWEIEGGRPKHYYHIKYAESGDGVHWDRRGIVCIDYRDAGEYAITRPCVINDGGTYRMWYSYRGDRYRIGYAESGDGVRWQRKDEEAGIDVSESGWDSEMIEYAHVFDHEGHRYMLYSGNDYSQAGIGLAVLEEG